VRARGTGPAESLQVEISPEPVLRGSNRAPRKT